MAFKTITIKKSVYQKLLAMKSENESFSDLFERLSKKNIETLKKMRGAIEFKDNEKDKLIKDLERKRREKRYG
jgi:predicted CopG family antitoxin